MQDGLLGKTIWSLSFNTQSQEPICKCPILFSPEILMVLGIGPSRRYSHTPVNTQNGLTDYDSFCGDKCLSEFSPLTFSMKV